MRARSSTYSWDHGIDCPKSIASISFDCSEEFDELEFRVGSSHWNAGGKVVATKLKVPYYHTMFVVLEQDLEFCEHIQPARFSSKPHPDLPEGTPVQLVGWGHPAKDGAVEAEMYAQILPVENEDTCADYYEALFEFPLPCSFGCFAQRARYEFFDDMEVPVFYNGSFEAFAFREHTDDNPDMNIPGMLVYTSFFARKIRKVLPMYS